MIGGYDPAGWNMSELGIGLSSQSRALRFVADERVACNGAVADRGGGIFDLKVPTDAVAGRVITCTYTSGKSSATFAFTAQPALAILSPGEHTQVTRSTKTPVTFRVGGQTTTFCVIAVGPGSKAWSYPSGTSPTETILDTSRFSAGPGFITLSQSFALPDLHWSSFPSVEGRGQAVLQFAVTWV